MSDARPKHTLFLAGTRRRRLSAETVFAIDLLACGAVSALPVRRCAVAYLRVPLQLRGCPAALAHATAAFLSSWAASPPPRAASDDRDNAIVCLLPPPSMRFGSAASGKPPGRRSSRRRRRTQCSPAAPRATPVCGALPARSAVLGAGRLELLHLDRKSADEPTRIPKEDKPQRRDLVDYPLESCSQCLPSGRTGPAPEALPRDDVQAVRRAYFSRSAIPRHAFLLNISSC